jgi:Protein of unknown function (DUF3300)
MNFILRFSTAVLLAMVFSSTSLLIGCKSKNSNQAANSQNASQSSPQNQPAAQMSVDDLVAPVALYPDQLLAQVLTLSTNSQEVLDVGNWLLQNQNLQGDALTNAAKQAGFSPSTSCSSRKWSITCARRLIGLANSVKLFRPIRRA